MATSEQIQDAFKILESKWDSQGECGSCGYHALLYEHNVTNEDIEDALDNENGQLELYCLNEDRDGGHRGTKIYLTQL